MLRRSPAPGSQPASQPTTAITPIIQQPATTLASHLSPIYPAINSAYCCKKSVFRIHARIERNSRIGAPVDHPFDKSCSFFFFTALSPLAHYPPLDHHRRKMMVNEPHLFPPPQPPAFPYFSYSFLPFIRTLGNDDQHLKPQPRGTGTFSIHSLVPLFFFHFY